ncbi:Plant lipid transfer protein/Par allergen [Corchorus olitorius]|uniref:Non-specific lipid-transfer protein n=1 Tax=Corchorus olitorius TaxID=93759 RepID=A0A1R3HH30_9ROSI|nr:Plant lipid transfer protein/Par allergen [Corchorus olitorius]
MKGVVISVLMMVAMVQFMAKSGVEATVSCQQVTSALAPCLSYLTTGAGAPPPLCCTGLGNLQKMAQSPADKQAACNCAKDAASHVPNIKEDAAASLPAKCNIQVDFPISKNTNCQE